MVNIGIAGLGFVGLSYAAVYSYKGYKVVGIDIDIDKINILNRGVSPVKEPKVEDFIKYGLETKKLIFDSDYKRLFEENVNVVFITVDTPTRRYVQDLSNLSASIKSIGEHINRYHKNVAIAVKSTILPGSSRKFIIPMLNKLAKGITLRYVFNPEFLREGNAVNDILYPSRIVIGAYDDESAKYFEYFFKNLYKENIPIIVTSLEAAELSKYASNLFLACKLSFINSLSYICESIGNCDILDIKRIMGLDSRIGMKYLHPGIGFGGSCLPKDLDAFIGFIYDKKPHVDFFKSIRKINEYQVTLPVKKALEIYGSLHNRKISILGLSYKGGINDIRGSRSLELVREFIKEGANIKVYDPLSTDDFIEYLMKFRWYKDNRKKITKCSSLEECIKDSDFIIVATDWEEFKTIDPYIIKQYARNPIIYDGRRILDPIKFIEAGVKFYGIGFS